MQRGESDQSVFDAAFESVTARPLYHQVRDRIIRLIDDGVLKVGDQLPSERALSAQLGVSRNSLRQAMSALEAQGLIEIRHGSGTYLVDREPGLVASDIADALIDSSERLPHVMEVRFAIEPFLTGLAAERRTPADIIAIRAALRMMEDEIALGESGEKGDVAFHAAVLATAHNPVLADLMMRLQPDIDRLREEALAQPTTPRLAVDAHHEILDAIESRDRGRAFRAAHQHLVDAAEALLVSHVGGAAHTVLADLLANAPDGSGGLRHDESPGSEPHGVAPVSFIAAVAPSHGGHRAATLRTDFTPDAIHKLDLPHNPRGCSPHASTAVVSAASDLSSYPDDAASSLRTAVAAHHGVGENQVVFGSGSDEVLLTIAQTFLTAGRAAASCEPTFSHYRAHTLSTGARYIPVPLASGRADPRALAAIASSASVLWVCNPNNPTGAYLDAEGLEHLLGSTPPDVLVVVDQAYAEYATAEDFPDAVASIARYPNLVVTHTFSKIHGLAAMRIGYGVAGERVAEMLNAVRRPFNTSSLAHVAAQAALEDQDFVRESRELNRRGRAAIEDFCRAHALSHIPSQANFVLFDAPAEVERTFSTLENRGFIVRPGPQLGLSSKIRLSVGIPEQIPDTLAVLKDLL